VNWNGEGEVEGTLQQKEGRGYRNKKRKRTANVTRKRRLNGQETNGVEETNNEG